MEIINPQVENYLQSLSKKNDHLHSRIIEYAERKKFRIDHRTIPFPIVGPLVGRILYQLTVLTHARRILELGSGFGYSAYWFAKAIGKNGELFLTDESIENLNTARHFLGQLPNHPRMHYFSGSALSSMKKVSGNFDIIFIDIDKLQYPRAFRCALPRLRKGGLMIADNVLWSGKVLSEGNLDPDTRGIARFNKLTHSVKNLVTSIIPVRDGIAVCLKVSNH